MTTDSRKQVAGKHVWAEAFAQRQPIEVPAPELGDGVVVRCRATFTVDDLLVVASATNWREPITLGALLLRLTMVDEDGQPVVDPDDDVWFQQGADGVIASRIARRAGLIERFVEAFRGAPDADGEELNGDVVRRVVAELALAMKLAPNSIRSWPLQDLRDVLAALPKTAD